MRIRFRCPSCLRLSLRATVGLVATSTHDLRCPKCRARWRFVVSPTATRKIVPDLPVTVHAVTNTTLLEAPTCRSTT